MIDQEWIESLKNGGIEEGNTRSRETLMDDFVSYYEKFEADEEEDVWEGRTFGHLLFDE